LISKSGSCALPCFKGFLAHHGMHPVDHAVGWTEDHGLPPPQPFRLPLVERRLGRRRQRRRANDRGKLNDMRVDLPPSFRGCESSCTIPVISMGRWPARYVDEFPRDPVRRIRYQKNCRWGPCPGKICRTKINAVWDRAALEGRDIMHGTIQSCRSSRFFTFRSLRGIAAIDCRFAVFTAVRTGSGGLYGPTA
jgi:hypothetical protein